MVWKDEKINKLLDVDSTSIETNKRTVRNNLNEFCNYNGKLKEKYISYIEGDDTRLQKPFVNLTEKIDNFYSKMMKVYELLEKIINYLDTKLDVKEKENEGEYKTYFIKSKASVLSRYDYNIIENKKEKKDLKEELSFKSRDNKRNHHPDDIALKLTKESSQSNTSKNNSNKFYDCEEEKVILIYKRYVKLYKDFYDSLIEKIRNQAFDIIHNKTIIGETALELYAIITNLAEFVMPLEYGIKIDEKIKIGIKFIKPLLNKIYNDLLWILNIDGSFHSNSFIKDNNNQGKDKDFDSSIKDLQSLESQEKNYFGLDEEKLDKGEIKSAWRHVKTRIYYTSQSHLYSLLNTLIYSMNSFLVDNGKDNKLNPIWNVFDLDYCSHIVFRLFENYNVDKNSKERYRIEIIVSPGADDDLSKCDDTHLVPLNPWIILNDHLTLSDIQKYFNFILG